MKLDELFFHPLRWLRLRIARQRMATATPSARRFAADRAGAAWSLPVAPPSNAEVLTAEARARLTRLRADAETRHRAKPKPTPPVTAFDESVFDGFRASANFPTETSPQDEIRTVFVPRDAAYARTIYMPRNSASERASGTP